MNKIETLHRKLVLHQETNCVGLVSDIDELIQIANDAEDEYDELKDTNLELDGKIWEFEENQADSEIKTGRDGGIIYKSSNLLDAQIIEAVKEIMESNVNQVSFLQHLQNIAKNGLQ